MHYGLHVRPLPVDPYVESHARIRASAAALYREGLQVFIHQHHALRGRFLEAVAELQGPPRSRFLCARGDLAGEAGFVIFFSQNAAAGGEQLGRRQIEQRQVGVHLPAYPLHEVGLGLHFIRPGRYSEMTGKAMRIARRTQSAAMNGSTPWKMARVGTCGSRVLSTNRFMPTGGLIRPISTTTTMSTPNQIGSRPMATISGKKIGTVSRIIDSSSIAVPSST